MGYCGGLEMRTCGPLAGLCYLTGFLVPVWTRLHGRAGAPSCLLNIPNVEISHRPCLEGQKVDRSLYRSH